MYIQFKHGFVEADRLDDDAVLPTKHMAAANKARAVDDDHVIVVRSRERSTVQWVARNLERRPTTFKSPPSWDYEFRIYLSAVEWVMTLKRIANELDYRNFKSWSGEHSSKSRAKLAHDIWHVAHDNLRSCVP